MCLGRVDEIKQTRHTVHSAHAHKHTHAYTTRYFIRAAWAHVCVCVCACMCKRKTQMNTIQSKKKKKKRTNKLKQRSKMWFLVAKLSYALHKIQPASLFKLYNIVCARSNKITVDRVL